MLKRILLLLAIFAVTIAAQEKIVHFKKLQDFLPKFEVQKFKREKPTGSTQTVMGYTVSIADVRYTEEIPETDYETQARVVTVKISDAHLYQVGLMAYTMLQDYESETESGYEKSYVVDGKYRGILRVSNTEYKDVNLTFVVGQRFLVEVDADNTDDLRFVLSFVNEINLQKLETLKGE